MAVPSIGSAVILVAVRIAKFGVGISYAEAMNKLEGPIMGATLFLVFGKLLLGTLKEVDDEAQARQIRKKNAKIRGEACCPWCGSTSIQYYALGIPYQEYSDSPIRRLNKKYHCNNCGRQW